MKRTFSVIRVMALAVLVGVGAVAQAEAVPVISIQPTSQIVNLGDAVSVDLVVSGLTEETGGFSALISFNDTILTGVDYVLDPDGNFDNDFDFSLGFTGGSDSPLDFFLTGDPAAGQPAAFTLATINFTASALGLSPLTLSGVVLSNFDGSQDLVVNSANGSVCVTTATAPNQDCQRIPEPGVLALVGAGLGALAVRRRKAAASRA